MKKILLILFVLLICLTGLAAKNANHYPMVVLGGQYFDTERYYSDGDIWFDGQKFTFSAGASYTGYFWGGSIPGAQDTVKRRASGDVYEPRRYSATQSSRGNANVEKVKPYHTVGMNFSTTYSKFYEKPNEMNDYDRYLDYYDVYLASISVALRQKINDFMFVYENPGIMGGMWFAGVTCDAGVMFDFKYATLNVGLKVSFGYNFMVEMIDVPTMIYFGAGYSF